MLNKLITVRSAVIIAVMAFSMGVATLVFASPSPSAAQAWTYQAITGTSEGNRLVNTLKTQGTNGWELVTTTRIADKNGKAQIILFLKKAK